MPNNIVKFYAIAVFAFIGEVSVHRAVADELGYKPINPSFGGNSFNGQYLLGSAQEQRGFEPPERKVSPVDELSETIQRALINQIGRDISDDILGDNAKESGSYSIGGTTIDFRHEGGEILININDADSGGAQTIHLPLPQSGR